VFYYDEHDDNVTADSYRPLAACQPYSSPVTVVSCTTRELSADVLVRRQRRFDPFQCMTTREGGRDVISNVITCPFVTET
jgi:hypothetical protein